MAKLEQHFLSTCPLKPDLYVRYIDDVFMIWSNGEEALIDFHERFNSFHSTINLIMDFSNESVHFLDTTVSIVNNQLQTSLYRKPTDKLNLLRWNSFHPNHIKRSIPYSQALRYHRICTNPTDRDRHLGYLKQVLIRNGYTAKLIDSSFQRATNKDRNELLKRKTEDSTSDRVPLSVQYHPQHCKLQTIIRDLQPIISDDPYLSRVFPEPPMIVYRQPHNLKSILVRSCLPDIMNETQQPEGSNKPCGRPRCQTCALINRDISITRENVTFNISGHYNCTSTNVVYLIRCKICSEQWYIGETKQPLHMRMNGHRSSIYQANPNLPVGQHFSLPNHCINDMMVNVLVGNLPNTHQRRISELRFIQRFNTHQRGLNKDVGFMAHYTFHV